MKRRRKKTRRNRTSKETQTRRVPNILFDVLVIFLCTDFLPLFFFFFSDMVSLGIAAPITKCESFLWNKQFILLKKIFLEKLLEISTTRNSLGRFPNFFRNHSKIGTPLNSKIFYLYAIDKVGISLISGGMMPLPEVYCLYNRARGTGVSRPPSVRTVLWKFELIYLFLRPNLSSRFTNCCRDDERGTSECSSASIRKRVVGHTIKYSSKRNIYGFFKKKKNLLV